jgi:hypothetical protein
MANSDQLNIKIDPELKRKYKYIVGNMSDDILNHITKVVMGFDDTERKKKEKTLLELKLKDLNDEIEKDERMKTLKDEEKGDYTERVTKAVNDLLEQKERTGSVFVYTVKTKGVEYQVKEADIMRELEKYGIDKLERPAPKTPLEEA